MEQLTNIQKKKECIRMYLTGKFKQRDIAKTLKVREGTICEWVKNIQPLTYFTIRKELSKELESIVRRKNYEADRDIISQLITDIERIEKLIIKAKNFPDLTQK